MYCNITKFVNKTYADINDILTYTINIHNISNQAANNMLFTDAVPNGTKFVENSVKVNGIEYPGIDPTSGLGVPIGILNANESINVEFNVQVVDIPLNNVIANIGKITYSIMEEGSYNQILQEQFSNVVQTTINNANVENKNFKKEVDKQFATIGEEIKYTFTLYNSGNVNADNVIIHDSIPENTIFLDNSVYINGIRQLGINPQLGINIGLIASKGTKVITFKVKIVNLPQNNLVTNKGSISYSYNVSPDKLVSKVGLSNEVITNVNLATLECTKSINENCIQIGDTITNIIKLRNTGNVPAQEVILKDEIPKYIKFLPDSLTINGIEIQDQNIENGISLNSILPNEIVNVSYKMKVENVPKNKQVTTKATALYGFSIDITKPLTYKEVNSNNVEFIIEDADFRGKNFLQTVSKEYVTIGDEITYNFYIKNGGNIKANDIVFSYSIPDGADLLDNSFTMNDYVIPGADLSQGVPIGGIAPNGEIKISFKTKFKNIPKNNIIENSAKLNYQIRVCENKLKIDKTVDSNKTIIEVKSPLIELEKSANPAYAAVGSLITYTIKVTNKGNVTAEKVLIRDCLSSVLEFQLGSLKVNGEARDENIINGINIGQLRPNAYKIVTFVVKILKYPDSGTVANQSLSEYSYEVDPSKPLNSGESNSNIFTVTVALVDVVVTKDSDIKEGVLKSKIEYAVTIENKGTIDVYDFLFKDDLPSQVRLIQNSFTLNGTFIRGVNLESGVRIGKIAVNENIEIKYKVEVVDAPSRCTIVNAAYGEYTYKAGIDSPVETGITNRATTKVKVLSQSFKQLCIDTDVSVPLHTPPVQEINDIVAKVDIIKCHVVKTLVGTSHENHTVTGYKLIVNGTITQAVEYTALVEDQSIHLIEAKNKFSTFIVLPQSYTLGQNIDINPIVEDITSTVVGPRDIFTSVTFMINADVL